MWATLALIAIGAAAHVQTTLIPILFTAYVMWSPWHYSGQNYGLMIMFARRGGHQLTRRQQQILKAAFFASYLMQLVSFNTGPSSDPLVLSLGLPASLAQSIANAALVVFAVGAGVGVFALITQRRGAAVTPPLVLLLTQGLWFVAPAMISTITGVAAPQTRYSSGVLALMHSAQYLWSTQYFAKRERGRDWSAARYWFTVIAGGIVLFLPIPWAASTLAHVDFTASMIIVTAIANIHHFMIDGVVWKLRDPRVSTALTTDKDATARGDNRIRSGGRRVAAAAAALGLAALAGVDQWRYRLASRESDAAALESAARLTPYDTTVQSRLLRVLIESGRYDDARRQIDAWPSHRLNLLASSPAFLDPRPPDWPPWQQLCGFLELPSHDRESLSPEVERFFGDGPAPVFMGFGSLMPTDGPHLQETVATFEEAARIAGCRAIVQAEIERTSSDRVLYVTRTPHRLVFPRCRAVVHHCGAGTTHTTLRAGAPSIPVPHVSDQFAWAEELQRLGAAPPLLRRTEWSAKKLASRISDVINSPRMKDAAMAISARMQNDNGLETAANLVERSMASNL